MNPITREEYYLAKMSGEDVPIFKPVTNREHYLAYLCGEDVPLPNPVTVDEMYLAAMCGIVFELPYPVTRTQRMWKQLIEDGTTDIVPMTREEHFWSGVDLHDIMFATVSGSLVTFTVKHPAPVEALTAAITPVQDLHGQTSPYPPGGGKNLLKPSVYGYDGVTNAYTRAGTLSVDGDTYTFSAQANSDSYFGSIAFSTPVQPTTYNAFIVVTVESNTLYSFNITNNAFNKNYIQFYDDSWNIVQASGRNQIEYLVNTGSFTSPVGATKMGIRIGLETGGTAQTYSTKIQIAKESSPGVVSAWTPYENICPITGHDEVVVTRTGSNILGGETMADAIVAAVNNATYAAKGSDTHGKYVFILANGATEQKTFSNGVKFKENTAYTFILTAKKNNTNKATNMRVVYTDGSQKYIEFPSAPVADTVYTFAVTTDPTKTIDKIQTIWASSLCTIYYEESGWFEGALTADQFTPYSGTSVTVELDGTRYGGTLDVLTGVLTVTQEAHVLNGSDGWINEVSAGTSADGASYIGYINKSGKGISTASGMFAMSSAYKFIQNSGNVANLHKGEFNGSGSYFRFVMQDGITTLAQLNTWLSSNPVTLVYELATPFSVQLTANELETLLGTNNIWANCGDVTVTYRSN